MNPSKGHTPDLETTINNKKESSFYEKIKKIKKSIELGPCYFIS
jgi:hypothetical protein